MVKTLTESEIEGDLNIDWGIEYSKIHDGCIL